jgi:hypothetical protein
LLRIEQVFSPRQRKHINRLDHDFGFDALLHREMETVILHPEIVSVHAEVIGMRVQTVADHRCVEVNPRARGTHDQDFGIDFFVVQIIPYRHFAFGKIIRFPQIRRNEHIETVSQQYDRQQEQHEFDQKSFHLKTGNK